MRVLLGHVAYRQRGGEDAVVANEAALLRAAGDDVTDFALHNDDVMDATPLDRVRLGLNTIWSSTAARRLRAAISQSRPDVVHLHNTFPQLSVSAYHACHMAGVPLVQTLHNFRLTCAAGILYRDGAVCEACVGSMPLPALRHRCYRGSRLATSAVVGMQMAHRLAQARGFAPARYIALTQFARARLLAAGLPAERVVVKPNFLPQVGVTAPAIAAPGDGPAYALFLGRLSEEKGLRSLLDGWAQVDSLGLRICGDGPLRAALQRQAETQRLNVQFLGLQDAAEVQAQLRNASMLVVPSLWYEGFPMVVLEAFAAARPVLCSRIGSLDELVEEGVTGLKFEPGSAQDIARAVDQAQRSGDGLVRMGQAARRQFEERYSSNTATAALHAIYRQAIAEGR